MNPANQSPFGLGGMLLPVIFIYIIFYFVLIKPQRKEQQEHKKLIANLKKNDEVITTGGIHGTIVNVKDTTFMLRVDDNVRIEINKTAIATVKKTANE